MCKANISIQCFVVVTARKGKHKFNISIFEWDRAKRSADNEEFGYIRYYYFVLEGKLSDAVTLL